jgi:hypothetical protein
VAALRFGLAAVVFAADLGHQQRRRFVDQRHDAGELEAEHDGQRLEQRNEPPGATARFQHTTSLADPPRGANCRLRCFLALGPRARDLVPQGDIEQERTERQERCHERRDRAGERPVPLQRRA